MVARGSDSPGRARYRPSNHCAGKAGVFPLNLYARVRIPCASMHTRPRVQRAPGLPCALCLRREQTIWQTSGKSLSRERRLTSRRPCLVRNCARGAGTDNPVATISRRYRPHHLKQEDAKRDVARGATCHQIVRRSENQSAATTVMAPGIADSMAARTFGTSGLRSASRFVLA
jgi:hypothetical protein